MSAELDRSADRAALPLAAALSASVIYLLIGVLGMAFGHPDEDAYILFIYSEILSDTGRIGFYADSPPLEGATDFLWMVILAGLDKLGIATAFGAQLLNALGVFLIAYLVAAQVQGGKAVALLLFGLALLVPALRFVHAGYVGFSAPLYAALILWVFVIVWKAPSARLFVVPLLSILLGLFRPDGVILGVFMTLSALVVVDPEHRRRYLLGCAVAAGIGLTYFFWRYSYFGYFLPLPLYVKSSLEGMPSGLNSMASWLMLSFGYVICAAGVLVTDVQSRKRLGLALLPLVMLMAALSLSHLSQNISYRFQAPFGVVLYYLATGFLAAGVAALGQRQFGRAALGAVGGLALLISLTGDMRSWKNQVFGQFFYSYIDTFPMYLSRLVTPDMTLVVTEAGRFPYWTPGRTFDLVGLNTPEAALQGASAEMIAEMAPDVIFIHTDYLVEFDCPEMTFCPISPEALTQAIAARDLPAPEQEPNRAIRAALAYFDYMAGHAEDYHTFAVHFVRGFPHLYSVAKDSGINPQDFAAALEQSFANPRRWSYMEGLNVVPRHLRH